MEQAVRWDLSHLFGSEGDFRRAFEELQERTAQGAAWQQRELASPEELFAAVEAYFGSLRAYGRLSVYAHACFDEDTRDGRRFSRKVAVQELGAKLAAAWAWLPPRVLALGEQVVERALAAEPRLAPYAFYLRDVLRQGAHLLPPGEERVLAELSTVARVPYNLYQILTHADLPFPELTLPHGEVVRLDQNAYVRLREHPDRQVREAAAKRFFATYRGFSRTLACALDAHVRQYATEARLRRFGSSLEGALFPHAVPTAVYQQLLAQAQQLLPLLFRLFELRRKALGLEQLAFYDLYVPWGEDALGPIPLEQAQQLLLEAVAPLGPAYEELLRKGFASGWMDPFPRPGKRSGAYCASDAYDVHPYVLLNYQGNLESVATLAHEWGHAIHSALANSTQPYPTADYPIFLAEIASTLNETLLFAHCSRKLPQPSQRLYVLSHLLEHFRGTFFRQAQFADFEHAMFRMVEQGEALAEDTLTQLYQQKQRIWLGHHQGAVLVEDDFAVEWAYIPHFFYGFYVYQYATSLAASTFFARQILAGEPGARERYLELLKAGGSAYPYQLLCQLGVDLASPEPYQELGRFLAGLLDEAEALLAAVGENRLPAANVS